ncbi:MAG: hypothetical protein K2K98_04060 [Muribaculaceae bacterium]|nr:hypothetical protein [Muribaculaceae bacterium]
MWNLYLTAQRLFFFAKKADPVWGLPWTLSSMENSAYPFPSTVVWL